jgi:hypothetical protein
MFRTWLLFLLTLGLIGFGAFGGCFIGASATQGASDYGARGALMGLVIGGTVGLLLGVCLFRFWGRPRPPD